MFKNTALVIGVTLIALATIAGTVILALTGHSENAITNLLVTGVGIATATGVLGHTQTKQVTALQNIAASVNGNSTTLINAAIASNSLTPEQINAAKANNEALLQKL